MRTHPFEFQHDIELEQTIQKVDVKALSFIIFQTLDLGLLLKTGHPNGIGSRHVLLVPSARRSRRSIAREEIRGIERSVWCTVTWVLEKEDLQILLGEKSVLKSERRISKTTIIWRLVYPQPLGKRM